MNITRRYRAALGLVVCSLALALAFAFLPQTPAGDKCEVCHNEENPHPIEMPCKQVDKYLSNHPGDYAGACQGMTNEKPPKP